MSQNIIRHSASNRSMDRQHAQALDRINAATSITQARINSEADCTDHALKRVTLTALLRQSCELMQPSVAPHAELLMNRQTFAILAILDEK